MQNPWTLTDANFNRVVQELKLLVALSQNRLGLL